MNTKQKVIAKLEGYKEEIYQKTDKTHQDSVWYDGDIAYLQYKDREIRVVACGEISIKSKDGSIVFDGKERGNGIKGGFSSDKDLKKIGNNFDDKYYWDMNNWFEIQTSRDNWDSTQDCFSQYDEVIDNAKEILFNDEYWGDK